MTEEDAVLYMKTTLGSIVDTINLTDEALAESAKFVQAIYGTPYALVEQDVKFRVIADFCAINTALNFAVSFYKFSADTATVEGNDVFEHLNTRWRNALALAQAYLAAAGLSVTIPGAAITPQNYGVRFGSYNANYLQDERGVL